MPRRLLIACLFSAALGSRTGALQQVAGLPGDGAGFELALRQSVGVALDPDTGDVVGGGPDYRARFDERGVRIDVVAGAKAAATPSLRFELESVLRGGELAWTGAAAAPRVDGDTVRYDRGGGVEEHYELVPEGVEQSFRFEQPLGASGELVVRGRLITSLAPASAPGPAGGLRFEAAGSGGIDYGGVTGIDALGRRAAGELRVAGDILELVLPAEFVDCAAWPLVLDPLIGGVIAVSSFGIDSVPDAAYDASTARYLVVWTRRFAEDDTDIRGQLFTSTGAATGGLITIESTIGDYADFPRVASCNASDRFLVVWSEGPLLASQYDVLGRAVSASTGALSGTLGIATTSTTEYFPDVGGEATTVDDELLVVYEEINVGIKGKRVAVPAVGDPSVVSSFTLSSSTTDDSPSISNSGGTAGRYLVAWTRFFPTPSPGDNDLRLALVDRNGVIVEPEIGVTTVGPDEKHVQVDGDGTEFLLAYDRDDADLRCRSVSYDSALGTLVIGSEILVDSNGRSPRLGFTGESYVLSWVEAGGGPNNFDVFVKAIDPLSCLGCEGQQDLQVSATSSESTARIAPQWAGAATAGDDALLVWATINLPDQDTTLLRGQRYQTEGSAPVELFAGCASGGKAFASCALLGNASFSHRLRHAAPAVPAFLVLGIEELDLVCGSCRLVPHPYSSFVFAAGNTSASGQAAVAMSIPASSTLAGLEFIDQWVVVDASAGCAAIGADLSSAIRVTLE